MNWFAIINIGLGCQGFHLLAVIESSRAQPPAIGKWESFARFFLAVTPGHPGHATTAQQNRQSGIVLEKIGFMALILNAAKT
ncbi:hypothetical protein [Nitrosomonas sp.]|uniref:hypothetical protein n=1 Tax=Nitrosomonas sp. TaxID=42353 RepID=UPI0025D35EA0|nr:hypothetical protein [Nitrosomonas sp.]